MRCVRAGLVESPGMPHAESLALVETLDRLRAAVGVRYPFEDRLLRATNPGSAADATPGE
jgi:hypothetical protein